MQNNEFPASDQIASASLELYINTKNILRKFLFSNFFWIQFQLKSEEQRNQAHSRKIEELKNLLAEQETKLKNSETVDQMKLELENSRVLDLST